MTLEEALKVAREYDPATPLYKVRDALRVLADVVAAKDREIEGLNEQLTSNKEPWLVSAGSKLHLAIKFLREIGFNQSFNIEQDKKNYFVTVTPCRSADYREGGTTPPEPYIEPAEGD